MWQLGKLKTKTDRVRYAWDKLKSHLHVGKSEQSGYQKNPLLSSSLPSEHLKKKKIKLVFS